MNFMNSKENFKFLIIFSDNSTPAKRTRRSTAASPSTAEGLASKPESAAVLNKKEIEEFTVNYCFWLFLKI